MTKTIDSAARRRMIHADTNKRGAAVQLPSLRWFNNNLWTPGQSSGGHGLFCCEVRWQAPDETDFGPVPPGRRRPA